VNTRIGNISILLVPTFPTTHLPNSMLRMIPAHGEFVDDRMSGLPLNVPSHRRGDVLHLMPYCGNPENLNPHHQYYYDQEYSTPYYYSVWLDEYAIAAEFAPAAQAGVYAFTFEEDAPRYVTLRTVNTGEIHTEGKAMSGFEDYHGVKHYFHLEFEHNPVQTGDKNAGQRAVRFAQFDTSLKTVRLRYGISYISVEQAKKNMERDISDFDINRVAKNARKVWNSTLGKIKVEGGTDDEKTTFYTSLYRAHERMVNISEDGRYYSAFDRQIHEDEGVPFWTDDWIWDTYHASHPLQVILAPAKEEQKLASYIRMYEQSAEKWMPTFPTIYGDWHGMDGNHAAVVFADALCKGLHFDVNKAFEGMKRTVLTESMLPWYRAPKTELDDFYHENGWYPAFQPGKKEPYEPDSPIGRALAYAGCPAASITLAAAYDDWCIAQMAKSLGKTDDYDFFNRRSLNYRNLFNKETGFFHPKDRDGKFIEPFDCIFSSNYFQESNAWTSLWDVHHNIPDLIGLMGGNEPFIRKLDQLFIEGLGLPKWHYYKQFPNATGNIGQYFAGNEPSCHIPYLYNYAGEPWKTQKRIRMIMESWYRNDLMGVPGDEDGGGLTAFYVFSAMGFYPVAAGKPEYSIGSPVFSKITISLENGKIFTVKANNASWNNKYIQSAKLNGQPWNKAWFTHNDITSGGTLELEMGNRPNKQWGNRPEDAPPSDINYKNK
jgi:predicted alpha-1,2-mannosidase